MADIIKYYYVVPLQSTINGNFTYTDEKNFYDYD